MEIQIRNETVAEPKRYGEIVIYCSERMQRLTSKGFSPIRLHVPCVRVMDSVDCTFELID